jgi:hypothetical protein
MRMTKLPIGHLKANPNNQGTNPNKNHSLLSVFVWVLVFCWVLGFPEHTRADVFA